MDTRVGPEPSTADLRHPATRDIYRFRHVAIARLMDDRWRDDFGWENTYLGHLYFMEALPDDPSSRELREARRVMDGLIFKLELCHAHLLEGRIQAITSVSTANDGPPPHQPMSLAACARLHILRSCKDPNEINRTPVPSALKDYLVFGTPQLLTLTKRNKPPATFILH